jgi:hypothetical protein
MATRIFLLLSALLWLPYGIYCALHPSVLAEAAGVAFQSPTGSTELRAMYGGVQAALGVLAALGALRPSWVRPALVAIAFATTGLGSVRLFGTLVDGGLSSYTTMALGFEFTSAVVALVLLNRVPKGVPT